MPGEHPRSSVFRDQVRYSASWKQRLAQARGEGSEAVRAAEQELGELLDVEPGILTDLFLPYRAVRGYQEMVSLVERMPRPLAKTPLIREQLGLALNRLGRRDEAEQVLMTLIEERGPSSESYGILGRIYKDHWGKAERAGETFSRKGLLEKLSVLTWQDLRRIGEIPILGSTPSPLWRYRSRLST